jgi:sec-independent protein translocase protein TatA
MPFGIGIWEILILLLVVLLVFGPKRLPEMGRSLGRGMREFKDSISGKDEAEGDLHSDRDDLRRAELPPAEQPVGTQTTSAPAPPRERDSVS